MRTQNRYFLTHLEFKRKYEDVTAIFVVFESILPDEARFGFEHLPGRVERQAGCCILALDTFDAFLESLQTDRVVNHSIIIFIIDL